MIEFLFYISTFIIFWAMVGYPVSLNILCRIFKKPDNEKDFSYEPTVTILIPAHNEEKVIKYKLSNLISIDYPKDKIEIIVASDNSTDTTNEIVDEFINNNKEFNIKLYVVIDRKGKTNAQNEAVRIATGEILIMTDANSIFSKQTVRELVASFTSDDIKYVTGRSVYTNNIEGSWVSDSESIYGNFDEKMRQIESKFQTITAGDGGVYACRKIDYHDFNPIKCHDSAMPIYYALLSKRAICNHDAVAYEKSGEVIEDEFKRKARMNREILKAILPDLRILNIFKYKWFTYFYFGHRTCRYLLWIAHLLVFVTNIILMGGSLFYESIFIAQVIFYLLGLLKLITKSNHRVLNMVYYYLVTVTAQWVGVYNILTGKAKPFWEKAESTR